MTDRLRGTDLDVRQMDVLSAYLHTASGLLEERQARHPDWADWRMEQLKLHLRRATILAGWLHDGVDPEGDAARAGLRKKRPELFADEPLVDVPRETSPQRKDIMTKTITEAQAQQCLKTVAIWIEENAGGGYDPALYEPGFHADGWTIALEGIAHIEWPWTISQDESVTWPEGVRVEAGSHWYLSLLPGGCST